MTLPLNDILCNRFCHDQLEVFVEFLNLRISTHAASFHFRAILCSYTRHSSFHHTRGLFRSQTFQLGIGHLGLGRKFRYRALGVQQGHFDLHDFGLCLCFCWICIHQCLLQTPALLCGALGLRAFGFDESLAGASF